jgi:hypothetical protein
LLKQCNSVEHGEVLAWGLNNLMQCGISNVHLVQTPTVIKSIPPAKSLYTCPFNNYAVMVSRSDDVIAWGYNPQSMDEEATTPIILDSIKHKINDMVLRQSIFIIVKQYLYPLQANIRQIQRFYDCTATLLH